MGIGIPSIPTNSSSTNSSSSSKTILELMSEKNFNSWDGLDDKDTADSFYKTVDQ